MSECFRKKLILVITALKVSKKVYSHWNNRENQLKRVWDNFVRISVSNKVQFHTSLVLLINKWETGVHLNIIQTVKINSLEKCSRFSFYCLNNYQPNLFPPKKLFSLIFIKLIDWLILVICRRFNLKFLNCILASKVMVIKLLIKIQLIERFWLIVCFCKF